MNWGGRSLKLGIEVLTASRGYNTIDEECVVGVVVEEEVVVVDDDDVDADADADVAALGDVTLDDSDSVVSVDEGVAGTAIEPSAAVELVAAAVGVGPDTEEGSEGDEVFADKDDDPGAADEGGPEVEFDLSMFFA